MKSFRIIACIVFSTILSTSTFFANNGIENENLAAAAKTYKELKKEVSMLLDNPKLKENQIKEEMVFVQFRVDSNNEIEILNINSGSAYLKYFVKNNLEHQKIETKNLVQHKVYTVNFSFVLK